MLQGRAAESRESLGSSRSVRNGGLSRRTVVRGAAWSLPIITAAAAMPLAAASVAAPVLKFVNGPYTATGCGPLSDVVLNLTTNGTTPDAGKTVTVALPAGLRWANGSTAPKSFSPTDANGGITIPSGQILGASATNAALTATSSTGASATAPVTVTPNLVARDWRAGDGTIATFKNPAATSAGWNFFFGPGGKLYHGDTLIASGVTSAVGDTQGDATNGVLDGVAYVDANGVANIWSWNPATDAVSTTALTGVPAGSRAVGWNFFLTPAGGLYHGHDLIDTGVTSAVGEQIIGAESVTYVTNGQARIYFIDPADPSTAIQRDFPAVPRGAGVRAVGHNFVLTAGGDLYHSSGELVGTGVSAAVGDQLGDLVTGATDGVSFVEGGVAKSYQWFPDGSTPITTTFATVPAGATPVGWNFFLAPDGGLYHRDVLAASNVVSAVGGEFTAGVDGVTYVESVAC